MSTDYAAVIYWYVAQSLLEQSPKVTQFSYALRDHGYELSHEGDLDKLCQQATSIANAPQHSMFILSGEPADIIVATVRLRTTSGQFGILPLMSSHDEAAVTQALLCGADNHVDPDASSSLFLASVGSVLRRIREGAGLKPEANKWTLLDEAWSVLSPDGARVSLTTIERAFSRRWRTLPTIRCHTSIYYFS
ncbi:hypothetical protein L1889_01105 [Paenalcaligenes niemegkensis]|uniref:hypothetical protein n=1 Tax=Paenalcaligenes niemegkensis TaxID=2895469 RepID=UPI001EE81BB3|nr:hypothetical protein [Paenalcaligenes niemegkensis]MCQ9615486.1 hypothetical protein [Paenalcaligenes niemegkensis]